jgi:cysteine-rich repeat protein
MLGLAVLLAAAGCDGDDDQRADPCAGVSCSDHGECVSDGVTAFCACDDGFVARELLCEPADAGTTSDAGPDAAADAATDAAADAAPPPEEVCNGEDDDLDGTIDEGCWRATGSLSVGRRNHSATLLADGRVLVAGGKDADNAILGSAELFDPADETWTPAGVAMTTPRHIHQAVRLADGRVLVAGGFGAQPVGPIWNASTSTVEIYDPETDTWTPTGELTDARYGHLLALLADGRVLAAGGFEDFEYPDGAQVDGGWHLDAAEVYDPATGLWSATGSMSTARHVGFFGLLGGGEVLFAGGQSDLDWLDSTLLYDSSAGTWSVTGAMPVSRASEHGHPTGALLPDGTFLAAGASGGGESPASAVLFDPATSSWRATGSMDAPRSNFTLSVLPDGRVLAAGGAGRDLAETELYDPTTASWSVARPLATGRAGHSATALASGLVLVCGGSDGVVASLDSCELYVPDPDPECRWSAPCGDLVCDPSEVCTACLTDCPCPAGCGDGILESGEECDDGNQVDDDLCGAACVAQPVAVNTTTDGDQQGPHLALTATGTLVAAWSDRVDATRTRRLDIRGVALDDADREINGDPLEAATVLGVVATMEGGSLVLFGDLGEWPFEIRGRRFDACGVPAAGADDVFAVSGAADFSVGGSALALPSGDVWLVWASSGPPSADADGQAIFGQRFDAQSRPVDAEPSLINTTFAGDQAGPSAALLGDGGAVVVWHSLSSDEIRFRVFSPDGTALSDDVAVATGVHARVAAIPGVGFVIAWGSLGCPGAPGSPAEVFFQRFGADGTTLGEAEQANVSVDGSQGVRGLASNAAGQFLILFADGQGCCGGCPAPVLRGRLYDAEGLPLGDELAVADLAAADAVALPDGSFAVVHETGDPLERDIAVQRIAIP